MAESKTNRPDSSKAKQVENTEPTDETTKSRDTKGVENDTDKVSGQNSLAAVPSDERDAREQYAALIRETESDVLVSGDNEAGEEYLYPKLPVNAQNPLKKNVIAYKHDPTGEANNS